MSDPCCLKAFLLAQQCAAHPSRCGMLLLNENWMYRCCVAASCGVHIPVVILIFGDPHAAGQQAQAGNAQQENRPECTARGSVGVLGPHLPVKS